MNTVKLLKHGINDRELNTRKSMEMPKSRNNLLNLDLHPVTKQSTEIVFNELYKCHQLLLLALNNVDPRRDCGIDKQTMMHIIVSECAIRKFHGALTEINVATDKIINWLDSLYVDIQRHLLIVLGTKEKHRVSAILLY